MSCAVYISCIFFLIFMALVQGVVGCNVMIFSILFIFASFKCLPNVFRMFLLLTYFPFYILVTIFESHVYSMLCLKLVTKPMMQAVLYIVDFVYFLFWFYYYTPWASCLCSLQCHSLVTKHYKQYRISLFSDLISF